MATPFLGEIRMFGGTFAPRGWALCNGQVLSISQNDALFALLGTTYGGDGQTTFALPNLQSRVPIHMGTLAGGSTYTLGEVGGTEAVTLLTAQLPSHTHGAQCNTAEATTTDPTNAYWAANASFTQYNAGPGNVALNANAVSIVGSGTPHDNMVPYLAVIFIIALEGDFPSPN